MKTSLFILSLFFLLQACKNNCQDCGPTKSGTYFLKNKTGSEVKFMFYGNSQINHQVDSIVLSDKGRKPFMYSSTGAPTQTTIDFDYYDCDSIKYLNAANNQSILITLENCNVPVNLLCTSKYALVNTDKVTTGKNKGDEYSEYELVLE